MGPQGVCTQDREVLEGHFFTIDIRIRKEGFKLCLARLPAIELQHQYVDLVAVSVPESL